MGCPQLPALFSPEGLRTPDTSREAWTQIVQTKDHVRAQTRFTLNQVFPPEGAWAFPPLPVRRAHVARAARVGGQAAHPIVRRPLTIIDTQRPQVSTISVTISTNKAFATNHEIVSERL